MFHIYFNNKQKADTLAISYLAEILSHFNWKSHLDKIPSFSWQSDKKYCCQNAEAVVEIFGKAALTGAFPGVTPSDK